MNYYHISFNGNLAGVWKPKLPDGSELTDTKISEYPEPDTPRICIAPSLLQSFYSVYPNVSQFFEEKNYPHMDFFVYTPENVESLVPQKVLTDKRFVWDAHITGEVWLTKPTRMKLNGKIRVMNPGNAPFLVTHPFDDKKLPLREVAPKKVEIKILKEITNW